MEAVLLSVPVSYLESRKEKGIKSAIIMLKFKKDIDKPISAILSINTIAHTIGAAGVGAQAVHVFGDEYFGFISAMLTFLILVLSEILPKSIGVRYCKNLSGAASKIIGFMILIVYPLVLLSFYLTKIFAKKSDDSSISREEISAMANIGTEEGILAEKENRIIQNIIKLKTVKVFEIITPRVVVAAADENMTIEEFRANEKFVRFSRIPIFDGDIEHITGYVYTKNVLEKLTGSDRQLPLKDFKREILVVNDTKPLISLWELFIEKKEHISIIINEYGGFDGIVTLEDILETLLGMEIVDEKDDIVDMQKYARERWKLRQGNI